MEWGVVGVEKKDFHNTRENRIKTLFRALNFKKRSFRGVCVREKVLAPFFVALLLVTALPYVHAQFFTDAFVVRTVNVFPGEIKAVGWKNADTLNFQNVDEYALYQDFNTINSATIDPSRAPQLRVVESFSNEDVVDTPVPVEKLATTTQKTVATTTTATTSPEATPIEFGIAASSTEGFLDQEVSETQTTTTQAVVGEEVDEPTNEEPAGDEPAVQNVATTTVLRRVESLFALAVSAVTSFFDTADDGATSTVDQTETITDSTDETPTEISTTSPEQEITNLPLATEEVVGTSSDVGLVVESEDAPTAELDGTPATTTTTDLATSSANTGNLPTATTTDAEPPDVVEETVPATTTPSSDGLPCTEDCLPFVITLADFSLPLDQNVEITGAQLRLSFAAQKKVTREHTPAFQIRYSINNGQTWKSAGSVVVDNEVSNSVNGGYFLFALPELYDHSTLNGLQIELVYADDPAVVSGLFVESAWLELFTLEAPTEQAPSSILELLENDGYDEEPLSGDKLVLPDGETISFQFTDENEDETLIVKSNEQQYHGLSEATTYFSVTNTSENDEEFTIQTYFPEEMGDVASLQVFNQNKEKKAVIPEYRPYVYHCEAGWEYAGEFTAGSLEELSQQLVVPPPVSTEINPSPVVDEKTASTTLAPDDREIEFSIPTSTEQDTTIIPTLPGTSSNTTTVFKLLPSIQQLVQFSTTTEILNNDPETVANNPAALTEESAATSSAPLDDGSDVVSGYTCRNTNVVRECDALDGGNTACRVDEVKVAEHNVTQYVPGWEPTKTSSGEMPKPGFFKRAAQFIGFGPKRKEVPDNFEVRSHSADTQTIRPGETLFFKFDISFPPFSSGEYWIEVIGDKEYGLLDPFWQSTWRYKKPITIDNTTGATSTEQQVFIELDSSASGFWSNVQNDAGDIRFIREESSGQTWYDQNWSNRLPIIIQASQVDSDLSNFPVYVNLSDLGNDFFADVQSSGADIRITTSDGETELPREIVSIDTGAKTGELHFKADTISSSADTTFYLYYNNSAASGYAANDTYGAENVWTNNFIATYHLEEDASGRGNTGLYTDSTANSYAADDEIDSTGKTGKLGAGQEIRARESSVDDYILFPSTTINGENVFTASFWLDTNQNGDQALLNAGASNDYLLFLRNTQLVLYDGGSTDTFTLDTDVTGTGWKYFTVIRDATSNTWSLYIDGVADNQNTLSEPMSALSLPSNCFMMGLEQDGTCLNSADPSQHLDGFVDEIRFQSVAPTAAEVAANFRNQNTPTSFYATSTIEQPESGSFTELDHWVQHFDYANQEADIWVQVDELAGSASTTIDLYYGNPDADSTSDEFAPFTYSTSTDLYYVVNGSQANPIVVYSLIDNNEVSIDGGSPVTLQAGETTSFATYTSASVISALGPITARSSDDAADNLVPISFASTTLVIPSTRNTEQFSVYAPFTTATVDFYEGNNAVPNFTQVVTAGTVSVLSDTMNSPGILESDEPILTFYDTTNSRDSLAVYSPVARDLFGIHSSQYYLSTSISGSNVGVFCSSGSTGTLTAVARGSQVGNTICTGANQGAGNAVRLVPSSAPISAIQQADGDGAESTVFLPEPEFGTRYYLPQAAQYISVACSPRFGSANIEIQDGTGALIASGSCTPGANTPGALNFAAGPYAAGYSIVSTNDVPFYMYYEENGNGDETNNWSAVQAKKFKALDGFALSIGAQEENQDAQYEQQNYRWYENNDSNTPSNAWSSETGTVAEGEAIAGQDAVNPGDEIRLRMNLLANNGTGTVGSTAFALQYAAAATCSAVAESSWQDLGDTGSTTAAFAGFNTSLGDGVTLTSTLLSDSDVVASYEEENFSVTLPNEVANGAAVEFDWSITPVSGAVSSNASYCFRMIRSTGATLATYTGYPQLLTAGPPNVPALYERFANEHATSTQPALEFSAVDVGGDELEYQLQLGTDETFSSTVIDTTSVANFDFENVDNSSDKAPFNNGARIRYSMQSTLNNGTTYWWRVRAIDPGGSNTYGDWSTAYSFTVNTSNTVSEWFQTTDAQFKTNTLTSATTSGSGSVQLNIAGSNVVGEYGTVALTNGTVSSVSLTNSYTNPVVVASIRYSRSISSPNQPALRVSNKTATGFDIEADNFSNDSVGTSVADYVVMEAGDWLLDDGANGLRVFATSTSVSAIAGNTIPADPGGLDVIFPTTFSGAPAVLTMVTTTNDPQWVVSSVYDGNNITNPPTASLVSLYLNDNLDSNGHGSAEDIDVIAFSIGEGTNDGVSFDSQTTAVDVTDTPNTKSFTSPFSSVPGVTLVQQLTMNGAQGGYAQVDLDNPATANDVTVSTEEGGSGADRSHAAESLAIVAFENSTGTLIRSGNAQVISTVIEFSDADVGNAWGQVDWTSSGGVTVRVQYQTGSGFEDVPDSALSGNSAGFSSGPVNILSLDTSTYDELRLVADLSGVDPELFDWKVTWGQRVDIPTLGDPFDNEKTADTTPQFDFVTSDPQGDDLEYEISYSTDATFSTASTTINSNADPSDFANVTTPADAEPFNSGDTVSYTVPGGSALTNGATYWWRVRAKDPNGSDAWSPWSDPDSFTINTATVVSSWFQTTQEQFQEGVIDGVTASTSGSVEMNDEMGEYGSTTVSDNTWTTIYTQLSYDEMVVVASPRYGFNGSDNARTVQVANKTRSSFDIKAENYTLSLSGSTDINYIVMEAGDWVLGDGGAGTRVVAGTAEAVSVANGSNLTYAAGTQITFSPAFSATPGALSTVSSANGNKWVSARIDNGTQAGEITATSMYVSLGVGLDTDTSRVPEDIDYIAFAVSSGVNNGVAFDALNSGDSVSHNDSSVPFNQTFATAPAVVVVQNNGMDGGDGGAALQDTDTPTTASTLYASVAEHGPGAGAHTNEIISVLAFESESGTIVRDTSTSGGLSGTIASEQVLFTDGFGPKFDRVLFAATTPANSTTSLQVQYQTATGSWALIPDTQIAGNSSGLTSSPVNLTGVDIVSYPVIRLLATLVCDSTSCPTLDDWTVEWSEGVALSGNLKQYDRILSTANATITAAVNGTPTGQTATTDASGNFTLGNVTAFAGDTVTVYVDDAADVNEAVGVFVYDGFGDMTGVQLYEQHVTITSDETPTSTLAHLSRGDNGAIGDEDVFFNVNAGGDLSTCAVGSCASANVWVGATSTFIVATSTTPSLTTHDFINEGDTRFGASTMRVSGAWNNQGALTIGTSEIIFTATTGTETVDDVDGTLEFYNLTFGEGSGNAIWQTADPLDINGSLAVNYGTLDRSSSAITLAGALATGANGYWSGVATTTFDGGATTNWSDANAVSQNVGNVVIDGAVRSVSVTSNVRAESIYIGANDTLNAGGAHDIQVAGDFTNTNTFLPQTSRLVVVGDSAVANITTGGSNLYSLRASSSNGSVAFTESTVTLLGNLEIATGTVTFPTNLLYLGGSLSNTGGALAHNNATVIFTGSGVKTVQLSGTPFLNALYNVEFTGAGNWSFIDTNATTTNNWTQTNGSVTLPSGQLVIGRDFNTSGAGSFDANGGEVRFEINGPDQVTTNGSALHDVRVTNRGGTGDWYDENWTYRIPLVVRAAAVDEDLSNFPVYIDLAELDADFFSNANSDGGDIRITEDDGLTEVPREVVFASTTAQTGELYFRATNLSSTTDTIFYLYYGNSAANDHLVTDTYGAENVWSNGYVLVTHMNDETTSTIVNSANGSADGTKLAPNQPIETTIGKIYDAQQNDGTDHITFPNVGNGATAITISAWFNGDTFSGSGDKNTYGHTIFSAHSAGNYTWLTAGGTGNGGSVDEVRFCAFSGSATCNVASGSNISPGTWHYVSASAIDGGAANVRIDGSNVLSFTSDGGGTWNSGSTIADLRANRDIEFDGRLDEMQISNVVRSTAWQDATYRNQATTSDFYSAGQPQQESARTFASGNVTATGNVILESGNTVFPSGTFTIEGSFDNNGKFDNNGGIVRFATASGNHTVAARSSVFHTLQVNGTGGGLSVTEHATATNAISLQAINNFAVNSGVVLESSGTFSNMLQNASTTWAGATLRLTSGTDFAVNTKTDDGDDYAELELTGDTDITIWNSTAATYDTQDFSSVYSQDHAGNDGDLYIFGDYERSNGTEYWSYATDFDGADLTASSSERQVNVRVANGSAVTFSTSTIELLGSPAASTTVNAQSGSFSLTAEHATVTAQHFTMTGTDSDGFSLTASSTVTSLDDSAFIIPASASAITVDATTVDTNPAKQFFNTSFISGGGNVNVSLSGSPTSFWWFRDGVGDRYGEAYDNADSDPGSIRWDDSNYTINISGIVYADDGVTPLGGPTCDGVTNAVTVVVDDGAYNDSVSCDGSNGSFSFSNVSYGGDPTIVVYINDAAGGERGSVITRTPTADITDLNIYVDRVMTRHEDSAPMTIAKMAGYDESDDTDLRFVAATGTPNTLTVRPDTELMVASSTTFVPGGNLTLLSGGTGTGYDGSLHLDDNAAFIATGNEIHSIGGSFFNDNASTFTSGSSTFDFTATTSGKGITNANAGTLDFHQLTFTGGGGWNLTADIMVAADMTVGAGIVSGTGDITMTNGTLGGNGTLSLGGGTTTILTSTTLGGSSEWTFYDLVLGDGATTSTTTRSNTATTTISGTLNIEPAHFLDAGASVWDLAGNGTVFVEDGTLLQDTSTFVYSGGAGADVHSTTYYNLRFTGFAGSPTYTFKPSGVLIENDLSLGGAVTTTVDLSAADPVVAVTGDVLIGTNGVLTASDVTALTLSGSYDNNGILTANSGEIVFASSDAYTIAAGSSPFADVTLLGGGAATVVEAATSTGLFTIASTSDFTLTAGETLAVGGQLSIATTTTNWVGSTLSLYGGGDYTVNQKGESQNFGTLIVGENTEIRLWDSSVTVVDVANTGSLYSQDHANVAGDLYIYGTYQEGTRTDHWSYATDFDGADLAATGNERPVNVYFANGSEAVWTGGGLSVLGTSTASTTVQNQGSGTYGLMHSGSSNINWQYVTVRDIAPDGVTFSGSPNLTGFSNVDLLVESDNGSAMTIGGSAITASPARTLSSIFFNSDVGVTDVVNVTATGTTLSGWRFTAHTGNLDGEANDSDPGGDPGYVIWDDSAAIISISGTVYEADGATKSSVCDDTTTNIVLAIAGSIAQNASSTCSSADGSYMISGVSFGSSDELMLYIDGEPASGVAVTQDPISSIADMDIYENHVIVRHENTEPLTIANMAVWDSSDDADIPYTAVTGVPDTLTIPANTKLLVWGNKEFAPGGNVTLVGGGAGAAYDGSFEALSGATFTGSAGETYSIGGHFVFATDATFVAGTSSVTLTSDDAGRSVTVNGDAFFDLAFNGAGSWIITDTTATVDNDLTVTSGTLTLSAGTTTIGGSLSNAGGINPNTGLLYFTADTGSETVTLGGADAAAITFAGTADWTITDTSATATQSFIVATGTVTLPSGVLTVGDDFIVRDTITHNSGTVRLTEPTGFTTLTLSGNDLYSLIQAGAATTTMTDQNAALLGDLTLQAGTFYVATNTLSVGGSLDASAAILQTASGTILFNGGAAGQVIDPGANNFYNVVFANGSGEWTLRSATTTNNFTLSNANSFTLAAGETVVVNGVFLNSVGGAATTWDNSTLVLNGANAYSINSKADVGDYYETLQIGADSDIRLWNSSATTTVVATSSSLYSQDHAAVDGALSIFGDLTIATTSEYWSYATDFDGAALTGGSRRAVTVSHAMNATTTVTNSGTLTVLGAAGATTTMQNMGTGAYSFMVTGGSLTMEYYALRDLAAGGLTLSGTPTVGSLSNGDYELSVNGGAAITLERATLDANPSLSILDTRFATTAPAVTGTNVDLSATSTNSWTFRNEYGNLSGESFDVDGISDCGSIRWDDSSCLLTEQTEYRWRYDDGNLGVPNSDWYESSFTKRQRVRVVNNGGAAYSNIPVRITVPYDADMQTNFADLRFTDNTGVSTIDFWVERVVASTEADVWVEVPSLSGNDTAQLYMYYGSSTAPSLSSSTATFAVVDDYEDNDIAEYSGETGIFDVSASFAYGGSYGLDLGSNQNTRLNYGIARFDQTIAQGETIRYQQYVDTSSGGSDEACTLFAVQSPVSNSQNYGVCLEQFGVDRLTVAKNVESTDSYGSVTKLATTTVGYTTGWYEVEIDWQTDNTIAVSLYNSSGSLVASTSATDSTYTSGGYGFTSWGQNGGWDSFTARPYIPVPPTTFFGMEQTDGGATYAALQNSPSSAFEIGDIARLRVAIENTGLDITGQKFTIEYAPRGAAPNCAAVAGAVYAPVPPQSTCGTAAVCMATSSVVANGAVTTDLLDVSDNTFSVGSFVSDPSQQTSATDLDQSHYTELEYAITPTINVTEQTYCFRVTDDGAAYDSYVAVPELSLKFDPILNTINLNNGEDISLLPGTTTAVYATGTVTDLNGSADLLYATSTIYRSGVSGGAACTPDNNDCYISSTPTSCQFINCAGNSCEVSCLADVYFHADPTDSGTPNEGEEWLAFIEVEDTTGGYGFASALGVELNTLRAIDVTGAINYGALAPNDDTGSYNASTSVLNSGNVEIDLEITGTDLSDGLSSTVPADQQKFATSTFTYSTCGVSCNLLSSSTPVGIDLDLTKPTTDTPPVTDDVYWGISVPFGTNSVAHQGINFFTPVSP